MRKAVILGVGLGLLAAGCVAPLPVIRLEPRRPDVVWVAGRAVVEASSGDVRVATAFDHQTGRSVGFRVEIENQSSDRVEVDPQHMQWVTCTGASSCSARQPVADPEQALLALDQARSREEANAANAQTAGAALVLLSATADAASIARGHGREAGAGTAAAAADMETSREASAQTLDRIDAERQTWSNEALRRTTLLPGHGIGGLVYVPLAADAEVVWLDVAVAGHDFWFSFAQTVFRAPPPPPAEADDQRLGSR